MRVTEQQIQAEQRERYEAWVKSEGGVERAVKPETYQEPAQIERTKWLVSQVEDLPLVVNNHRSILELGCSGAHQLLAMNGLAGVDLNPDIIMANKQTYPDRIWITADITQPGWDIMLTRFDCVVLPEILEHLEHRQVRNVVLKAKQLAKRRLLVTIPDGRDWRKNERNACCFKHRWIATETKLEELLATCSEDGWRLTWKSDGAFVLIRADHP